MTLRIQLRLHMLATVITALIIGAVLFGLHWKLDDLYSRELAVQDVANAVYRLRNFALEYLVSPHQRVIVQWNSNHERIDKLLRQVVADSRQEQELLNNLMNDQHVVNVLFFTLTAADTHGPEARSIIIAQMLIKAQGMVSDVQKLDRLERKRIVETQENATLAVTGLIAGLVIVVTISGLRLGHRVMVPLGQLMIGAQKVGGGDLDYRIDLQTRDEIGSLARRFDRMTASLARGRDRYIELNRDLEQRVAKRTAQLEAVNRELESFSYSVSHDLRVPLRAIDGFSRIILEEYRDKLDAEGQRLLNLVLDNTGKMAQLIDDILAFSRTGRREMTTTAIDMAELAREVMAELKPMLADREVKWEIKPLPPARADRAMMTRVFTNLFANAIKFTRPKPAARIEVGAITGERETTYYVRDNGVGFDMRYLDKLFGVFQRLHGPDEFEGTGIGLAVVKRVITRHGGRVWAEGKVGEGATFYFVLPLNP